jgi:hypothetical protein
MEEGEGEGKQKGGKVWKKGKVFIAKALSKGWVFFCVTHVSAMPRQNDSDLLHKPAAIRRRDGGGERKKKAHEVFNPSTGARAGWETKNSSHLSIPPTDPTRQPLLSPPSPFQMFQNGFGLRRS